MSFVLVWFACSASSALAGNEEAAQKAALMLALPLENAGFDFHADIWSRELMPEAGKAVRMQMFKGNDYRVCASVSPSSGVQIVAHVMDAEGKVAEHKVETTSDLAGVVLHVKPKHTGVYLFVVKESGGKLQKTFCAMISGYK